LARRLLAHTGPVLAELGELEQVTASLASVLHHGNGAIVQHRTLARRGKVADVIDVAARRTFEGCVSQKGVVVKSGPSAQ
jgi:glutamate---cysteine ligase / carboxylate-amine ligase